MTSSDEVAAVRGAQALPSQQFATAVAAGSPVLIPPVFSHNALSDPIRYRPRLAALDIDSPDRIGTPRGLFERCVTSSNV
ncbi:hypothetical protein CHU98_g2558 [Xylaria longipes]|nr:hypothetical protein CHU98_g2558 [Xylaria longipes]